MGFNFDDWEKEFSPLLKTTRRWEGFSYIAKHLAVKETPKIFEVGCIRVKDSWEADGQSTRVWNWIMQRSQGRSVSVDLNEEAVALTRILCSKVGAYVDEGIRAIALNQYGSIDDLDILFLDGMDFTGPHAHNSWMQHIAMLGAAWPKLKKGCLIVVDDCTDNNEGKHVMIKDFFRRTGNKPVVESYMHIWEMK